MPKELGFLEDTTPAAKNYLLTLQEALKPATRCLSRAQERQQELSNRKKREEAFQLGDRVMLSCDNLPLAPALTRKFAS